MMRRTFASLIPVPSNFLLLCSRRNAFRCRCQNHEGELRKAGLEITQFGLLTALAKIGEGNQKLLSAGFAMDSTTLSRTLAPLLRQGWVRVRPGKDKKGTHP